MSERRDQDRTHQPPVDAETEVKRTIAQLTPYLRILLQGKESFQITIHGKPGKRCQVEVTLYLRSQGTERTDP